LGVDVRQSDGERGGSEKGVRTNLRDHPSLTPEEIELVIPVAVAGGVGAAVGKSFKVNGGKLLENGIGQDLAGEMRLLRRGPVAFGDGFP